MSWNKQLTKLNGILAELYPIKDQSYRVIDMAGIPVGNIAFKDAAVDNWYYILKEAERHDKTEDLVQVVLEQYDREDLKNIFVEATERQPLQPVENTYLRTLKALMRDGDMNQAVEEFEKIAKEISTDLHNDVLLQSGRLRRITNDKKRGLVSDSEYRLEVNKINHAILSLIDDIPEEQQLTASRNIIRSAENNLVTPPIEELEKVFGKDELMEINWLQKAIQASRSVCKVEAPVPGGYELGTGFVLKGGYLLTNNHVIETAEQAAKTAIFFNFQVDINGNLQPKTEYRLDASVFVTYSYKHPDTLDYTLVKIKDHDGKLAERGHLELETNKAPDMDERVNIIQHPEGKSMKIALPDNIIGKRKQYLFYVADTKKGSSGSPVFNQNWKVIALHHAGKDTGKGLQINDAGDYQHSNRGILIKNILEDIKSKGHEEIVNAF